MDSLVHPGENRLPPVHPYAPTEELHRIGSVECAGTIAEFLVRKQSVVVK